MYKKIILFIIIFIVFNSFFSTVFGNICPYTSQINKCITENGNKATIGPKGIEDFLCITSSREKIIFQIVLDENFKKVDKEIDEFIFNLEKNKNKYFGLNKDKTYIEGVNDIFNKKNYFEKKFRKLCGETILKETMSCSENSGLSIKNYKNFIYNNGGSCDKLVNIKMDIFEGVSFSILKMNKMHIKTDEKKIYDQGQRSNYNKLIDIMNINLGYLERIWKKTVSFIENTY